MYQFLTRVFLVVVLCVFANPIQAATLYIVPGDSDIHPGDTVSLAVRIDTDEDECINAVDGVITFPDTIVLVDIALGNSIFPVWVEEPTIDKSNGRVTFAGGIPNGYCGRIEGDPRLTNVILELIIQAPGLRIGIGETDPVAHIDFSSQTQVFLNDGAGTRAQLRTIGATMLVNDRPRNEVIDDWNARIDSDESLPTEFSISLNSDKSIYSGKYFIVFNTTDKQSGIDHYEVIEEPLDQINLFKWGAVDAPWKEVKSPYLLSDQSLNSTIRVKAIDKAGNEYIAILVPDESMRGASDRMLISLGLGVFGFIVLLVLIGAVLVYRRKIRSYSSEFTTNEPDQNKFDGQ